MVSLGNIKAAYKNPDILLEASRIGTNDTGRNIAVDVSAKTRLITLRDAELKYREEGVFIPGKSYLISFRELEEVVKKTREVTYGRTNIFDRLVYEIIHGRDAKAYLKKHTFIREDRLMNKWIRSGGLEDITNFAEIFKIRINNRGRINRDGLVVLQSVAPIALQKCSVNNANPLYKNRFGKINLPLEVEAPWGQFTFYSNNGVKTSDGDDNVGICNEGIYEFENLSLHVLGEETNDASEIKDNKSEQQSQGNIRKVLLWGNIGFILGSVPGAIVGITAASNKPEEETYTGMMKIAFHGIVKDKRAECV